MSTRSQYPGRQDYLAYETGLMSEDDQAEFFQRLVDTGAMPDMNQTYLRRLAELVAAELVFLPDAEDET